MAENPPQLDSANIPEAIAAPKSGRSIQLVWIIPLVAALIGGWLAVKAIMDKGPVITISFKTAEGLEAGKTKLKYKDVDVGLVTSIVLSPDIKHVIVTAELGKNAAPYLVDDTRFWVVRPRISGGNVSGLGTLLSGSYVGVDIGTSKKSRRDFVGLETAPVFAIDAPGREFVLKSEDIGSLNVGSPIFFRRLEVGQITAYDLDKDGNGVTLKIFVRSPFDKFVTTNARFWHASGIDVTLDSTGIKVDTQSLMSILIGGIAFETPHNAASMPVAEAKATFALFANRGAALKNPEREVVPAVMVFNETVRGLAVGAPIDFRGIVIGEVTAINLDIDPATRQIVVPVSVNLYPGRMRSRSLKSVAATQKLLALDPFKAGSQLQSLRGMVSRGLRAQLRTGNLLTGQLYIAADFFPDAAKVKLDLSKDPVEIPTIQSNLRELQAMIARVAEKVEKFPLDKIGTDLRQTLKSADKLMQRLDTELTPEATAAMVEARKALASADRVLGNDSSLQQSTREMMREVARAAQAFRNLADYLERHPEALISGKKEEPK